MQRIARKILCLLALCLCCSHGVFAAFIRYGGFGFEPAKQAGLTQRKKVHELCLAIMEVSPFESRSITYQQEQFYALVKQKPAIREHISESLGLDSLDFADYLHRQQSFMAKQPRCVGLDDFFIYLQSLRDPLPSEAIISKLVLGHRQPLAFFLPEKHFDFDSLWLRTADLLDPYIIKHYSDPLEETEKRWQPGDRLPVGLQLAELQGTGVYLEIAQKFLAYYSYVGQVINIKKVKPSAQNANSKVWSVRLLRYYTVDKRYDALAAKIKADKYPQVSPSQPVLSWRLHHLQALTNMQEKHRATIDQIHRAHQQELLKIPKKLKGRIWATSEYESLEVKIAQGGSFSQEDYERYQELKAEIEFGIRSGDDRFIARSNEKIKNALRYYNYYGTDTIADRMIDYSVELTLKQLLPLSKMRNRAYRMSRFGDGFFVLTTTILGLAFIPFTGGLSVLAAAGVGVLTTDFFSVLGSLARHEPMDSMMARLAIRSTHTFVNGFVPGWNEGNSFFTSMDDLRVGAALDQKVNNLWKSQKNVIKARPEVLGRPFVLALLQERLKYLREELLPLGKRLYGQAVFSPEQERFFAKTLQQLQQVEHELAEDLLHAAQRYEYLLARGRIPNSMHFDIAQHLQRYKRTS